MPINEIEIPKTSITFRVMQFKCESLALLSNKIIHEAEEFSVDPETAGFHDCEGEGSMVRGFFSTVIPFEVECLVDGITTKKLEKRIETCEFIALENRLYVTGKTGLQKILEHVLAELTGYGVSPVELEFRQLSQFSERLTVLKSIGLVNPKTRDVRRVKMTGKMEEYTDYNVIDPKNHGIESVAGVMDTPLGQMTVTVSRKGSIRLNVEKGFVLAVECLEWLMVAILDEEAPKYREDQEYLTRKAEHEYSEGMAEAENDQARAEEEAAGHYSEHDRAQENGG